MELKYIFIIKSLSPLLRGLKFKKIGDYYCINCVYLEQKVNLNQMKMYVKIMIIV